ncbi:zinc ribbon domain-containing protein [Candidatus Margulisiibacteriota bacterium]
MKKVDNQTCPVCNSDIEADARFCPECGSQAAPDDVPCMECGTRNKTNAKYCLACGTIVSPEAEAYEFDDEIDADDDNSLNDTETQKTIRHQKAKKLAEELKQKNGQISEIPFSEPQDTDQEHGYSSSLSSYIDKLTPGTKPKVINETLHDLNEQVKKNVSNNLDQLIDSNGDNRYYLFLKDKLTVRTFFSDSPFQPAERRYV